MTHGPQVVVIPDGQWKAWLHEKGVKSWYSAVAPPGAFIHTDGDGQPGEQDTIWVKERLWKSALAGRRTGLQILAHEFFHSLVPKPGRVPDTKREQLEQQFGHPKTAIASIMHAFRTGFATNAFSRIFRWRRAPAEGWEQFEAWMEQHRQQVEGPIAA